MEPEGIKNKGKEEMAQQEEPLYDFPEPTQPPGRKPSGQHRGRGSLRSISVLDRLLLTVPVWFQLSINPATALHILQREPPGTFLVRKSRTSQRNVLCLRLADDSVPSFVQQFGIREAQSSKTLSLETSAISFPDLPRLMSFYCVSRDVLPFPLELPEAIAKATSHKELESISHMGIEFWNSHLNVRGPREAPRPQTDEKPDTAQPVAPPQTGVTPQPDSAPQGDSGDRSDTTPQESGPGSTLFHEFCPIRTRSPRELDCGSGQGALCFINPLFLQSESPLSRRRMFKRSLKVRVSTESSTLLSPPLAPPPPPPLMPKTKGKCKTLKDAQEPSQATHTVKDSQAMTQKQDDPSEDPGTPHIQVEQKQSPTQASAQLPAVMEGPDNSDYMQPSPMITSSNPMVRPHFPKAPPSLSPHSPRDSPLLSPYLSQSLSPKMPLSQSPYNSPTTLSSLSPYQFPSLSPFTPLPFPLSTDEQRSGREDEEDDAGVDRKDENYEITGEEEEGLILQMNTTSLSDTDSCSSYSSLEGAADTPS